MMDIKFAHALGWASMGIAAVELFGQGRIEKEMLGIKPQPRLMRALGLREMVSGLTILTQRKVTSTLAAGLWSRVAGDAMDLALLATAAPRSRRPDGLGSATLMVTGITALDLFCAMRIQHRLARNKRIARTKRFDAQQAAMDATPMSRSISMTPPDVPVGK